MSTLSEAGSVATFRETLKALLVQKDITVLELAKRADISYNTAKGYTSKNVARKPSVPHLIAIAKALDVSLELFRECEDLQNEKSDNDDTQGKSDNP